MITQNPPLTVSQQLHELVDLRDRISKVSDLMPYNSYLIQSRLNVVTSIRELAAQL